MTPDVDASTDGYLSAGVGNYGLATLKAQSSRPLVDDRLSGRVAIRYAEDDGYWENGSGPDMGQTDVLAGRATLNYQATDQLQAVLKLTAGQNSGRSTPPRITATLGPWRYGRWPAFERYASRW